MLFHDPFHSDADFKEPRLTNARGEFLLSRAFLQNIMWRSAKRSGYSSW